MIKHSAGLLVYRKRDYEVEVLLVRSAGPIWGKKDIWSIPKGEMDEGEDHLTTLRREFEEEVGVPVPEGELIDLGSVKQSNGKINSIWAVEGEVDLTKFSSNSFTMEWPPKSGIMQEYPENDAADWFGLEDAKAKIFQAQVEFIERLAALLRVA